MNPKAHGKPPMKYNRRRFVKTVAAGVGGACLLAAHGAAFAPWRFFNAAEARLVDAITERIIPADQDPGASEAGVINFLDKQLASRLRRHQQTYRDGLVGVEETSRVMFEGSFVALSADCHATHSLDTRRSCAQCHPPCRTAASM